MYFLSHFLRKPFSGQSFDLLKKNLNNGHLKGQCDVHKSSAFVHSKSQVFVHQCFETYAFLQTRFSFTSKTTLSEGLTQKNLLSRSILFLILAFEMLNCLLSQYILQWTRLFLSSKEIPTSSLSMSALFQTWLFVDFTQCIMKDVFLLVVVWVRRQ